MNQSMDFPLSYTKDQLISDVYNRKDSNVG